MQERRFTGSGLADHVNMGQAIELLDPEYLMRRPTVCEGEG
jgi:hypothetical protein